jgi:hypothetical protein
MSLNRWDLGGLLELGELLEKVFPAVRAAGRHGRLNDESSLRE